MKHILQKAIAACLIAGLAACGGGGGDADVPVAAARVEITQTGLVLSAAGASAQLDASAFDAGGARLDAPLTWSSSRPGTVSIDARGRVTAVTTGSAQIVARSGALQSAPLLVLVATVAPGATLLDDAQIVGEPVETDPAAPPSRSNTYRIELAPGTALPDVGALLGARGSKPVSGRVVAVDPATRSVTLVAVSPRLILPDLRIDERLDLTQAPVVIPADIAARYDVQRSGDTFVYTPKAGVAATRHRPLAATGTRALPPFEKCETSITGVGDDAALPIGLSAPPAFSFTMPNTFEYVDTPENGVEKLLVMGEPTFKVEAGVGVTAAFEGKVECEATMGILTIPVGGLLAWVAGGQIPYGMGIELSGKLTLATMAIGAKAEVKTTTKLGFQCAGTAGCDFVAELGDFVPTAEWTTNGPSVGDFRVDASAAAFGFVKANFGSRIFTSLQVEGFKAKLGGKLTGSFAPQLTQITDTSYKSDYTFSVEASAGIGQDLEGLLKLLGVSSVNALELSTSLDLARSPTGTVTADRKVFTVGDHVTFNVNLDNVEFVPGSGRYNVDHVLLIRNSGGTRSVVGRVDAVNGQRVFDFGFDAAGPGSVGEFFAFVVTKILPVEFASLEVAAATPPTVTVAVSPSTRQLSAGDSQTFVATVGGTTITDVVWSANGGSITDQGVFTAPDQSATVVVKATSVADPDVSAQAVVTVGNPAIAAHWRGLISTTYTRTLTLPSGLVRTSSMSAAYQVTFDFENSDSTRTLSSIGEGSSVQMQPGSSTIFGHSCEPPVAGWSILVGADGGVGIGMNRSESMRGYFSTDGSARCAEYFDGLGPTHIPGFVSGIVVGNTETFNNPSGDRIENGVIQGGGNTFHIDRSDPAAGITDIIEYSISWSFAPG